MNVPISQTVLERLFSPNDEIRWDTVFALYAPDGQDSPYLPSEDEPRLRIACNLMGALERRLDVSESERSAALAEAIRETLSLTRRAVGYSWGASELTVALRPVRTLHLGILADSVCQTLYDFHRGRWASRLSRPDHYTIQTALAATLAALPAPSLAPFWYRLQFGEPLMRRAMSLGLEYLRTHHAVSGLLFGLTYCTDHTLQGTIVDCLEQIADPLSLTALHHLRRETAATDWTLSRHLARAIAVIERQNAGQYARTLLRPTNTQSEDTESLLRPLSEEARRECERQTLLRSRAAEIPQDTPTV